MYVLCVMLTHASYMCGVVVKEWCSCQRISLTIVIRISERTKPCHLLTSAGTGCQSCRPSRNMQDTPNIHEHKEMKVSFVDMWGQGWQAKQKSTHLIQTGKQEDATLHRNRKRKGWGPRKIWESVPVQYITRIYSFTCQIKWFVSGCCWQAAHYFTNITNKAA